MTMKGDAVEEAQVAEPAMEMEVETRTLIETAQADAVEMAKQHKSTMSKPLILSVCTILVVVSIVSFLPSTNRHSAPSLPQRERRRLASTYGLQGWKVGSCTISQLICRITDITLPTMLLLCPQSQFFQRVSDPETITVKDIINIQEKLAPPPPAVAAWGIEQLEKLRRRVWG